MRKLVYVSAIETPVGRYVAIASDNCLLMLSRKPLNFVLDQLRKRHYEAITEDNLILEQTRQQLSEYFTGSRRKFTVELCLCGTIFQKKVWHALMRIPYGEVVSYKQVASMIGNPRGYRAVGNAVGANPIPIIIPCHRVVKNDYTIGGYSDGVEVKKKLLELEGAIEKVRLV